MERKKIAQLWLILPMSWYWILTSVTTESPPKNVTVADKSFFLRWDWSPVAGLVMYQQDTLVPWTVSILIDRCCGHDCKSVVLESCLECRTYMSVSLFEDIWDRQREREILFVYHSLHLWLSAPSRTVLCFCERNGTWNIPSVKTRLQFSFILTSYLVACSIISSILLKEF